MYSEMTLAEKNELKKERNKTLRQLVSADYTGALYKFKYKLGNSLVPPVPANNGIGFESGDLELLWIFNAGRLKSKTTKDRIYKGNMEIEVLEDGYNITVNNGKTQNSYQIPVTNMESNTIGFISTHYKHSCSKLGAFELKNIKIYTKAISPDT